MPLIEYPNVPRAPGVPDLRRTAYGYAVTSGIMGRVQGLDAFGLLSWADQYPWQILGRAERQVLIPDSVYEFEYVGGADFKSSGAEINRFSKVPKPGVVNMRMTCGGSGLMGREQFLDELKRLKDGFEVCTLVTPDQTYKRMSLESFDYKREGKAGQTLLSVYAVFKEMNSAEEPEPVTKNPSGADPVSTCTVKPAKPSTDQLALYYVKQPENIGVA
ncbi:phage baseplate protein [Pseudomonas sp. GV071]|uniref:phage baseplate protein n=1 Tax=Pseudomonas sp. GV071 TaxID=2135754 RepID=UPI000D33A423|nr:hypothetical protein [Pseudomonas sp. GV071]PTQ70289.1 hypothetical protein C8K61_10611 [Pseudomonas sp. GV071]